MTRFAVIVVAAWCAASPLATSLLAWVIHHYKAIMRAADLGDEYERLCDEAYTEWRE